MIFLWLRSFVFDINSQLMLTKLQYYIKVYVYFQRECIEKYVVPCRKLRWICRNLLNDVVRQVEVPKKSTIFVAQQICFVARHNCLVTSEVTLHHCFKTLWHWKRLIITCEVLRHAEHFLLYSSDILWNIYSMNTYVLHRASCLWLVALYKSLTMIVTSFYVQSVIEHRHSWN